MQGRLRNERLAVEIDSECAHCGQGLYLTLDSELVWNVKEHDASPLVFEPEVDWKRFTGSNIIHDY